MAYQADRAYPGFCRMTRIGVFLFPLDEMPVHHSVIPSVKFAISHLYVSVGRGTIGVNYLTHEHSTISPARARTQTARSVDERINYEATAPPIIR